MHRTRSRIALSLASSTLLLSALLPAAPAAALPAQTRPDADAYQGLRCFATVMSVDTVSALIVGSRDPGQEIYSVGDGLYLQIEPGALVNPGDSYEAYRVEGEIEHPHTGRDLGEVIVLVGTLRVLDVSGDRAHAVIEDACGEIEIGERLHPALEGTIAAAPDMPEYFPYRLVTPSEADATVVYGSSESLADLEDLGERDGMSVRRAYAAGDVVTLDRGSIHGWTPGTPVLFYEPDPAIVDDGGAHDEPVVVAQGYLIWSAADTAAALITEGDRVVEIGARARVLTERIDS